MTLQLIRKIEDLDIPEVKDEEVVGLANARVVIADYDLLQSDFPQLRDDAICAIYPVIGSLIEKEKKIAIHKAIDRWLCHNGAFISKNQLEKNEVNTDIKLNGQSTIAYRPPRYGRALVVSVRNNHAALSFEELERWKNEPNGFLDLKGCGVGPFKLPKKLPHSSGLLWLSRALSDYAMEKMIQRIFIHANVKFSTIPSYAILDSGINFKDSGAGSIAAGIHIRRAHQRRRSDKGLNLPELGSYEQKVTIEIERLLRRYGITSCGTRTTIELDNADDKVRIRRLTYPMPPSGNYPKHFCFTDEHKAKLIQLSRTGREVLSFEGMNIQLARLIDNDPYSVRLVDFGQYNCRMSFKLPFYSRVKNQPMLWGAGFKPSDPEYVRPDSKICLPTELWQKFKKIDAHEISRKFRSELITRETIVQTFDTLIKKSMARW